MRHDNYPALIDSRTMYNLHFISSRTVNKGGGERWSHSADIESVYPITPQPGSKETRACHTINVVDRSG